MSVLAGEDSGREKTFTDKEVCRPFLLGICINDLFVNTVSYIFGPLGGGGASWIDGLHSFALEPLYKGHI